MAARVGQPAAGASRMAERFTVSEYRRPGDQLRSTSHRGWAWGRLPTTPISTRRGTHGRCQRHPAPAGSPDHELVVLDVDHHRVPVAVATFEQPDGQAVADLALDEALERSSPVHGVVAAPGQPGPSRVGHLEAEAAVGQAPVELAQLDIHDLGDVVLGERPEAHDLVD